jgi:hypothetical protein
MGKTSMTDEVSQEVRMHEEGMMHAEMHFLKSQQWNVTNYALLLCGAALGVSQLKDALRAPSTNLLIAFVLVTGGAAVCFLAHLEKKLSEARRRAFLQRKRLPLEAFGERRSPEVFFLLNIALLLAVVGTLSILRAHLCVVIGSALAIVALFLSFLGWNRRPTVRAGYSSPRDIRMQSKRLRILEAAARSEEDGKTFTPAQIEKETGIPWYEVCNFASRYWYAEGVETKGLFEPAGGTRFGGTPDSSEKDQECRLTSDAAQHFLEWTSLEEARAASRTAMLVAAISIFMAAASLIVAVIGLYQAAATP